MADGGSDQKVSENAEKLRELFLTKHSADIENGLYDDRDVEKFRSDDKYVSSFIRSYESLQDACDHFHESLKFRLEYGMNDMTPDTFPQEIWERGAVYYHNRDKDGHRILYLQVKLHKKEPEITQMAKRLFSYLIEVHYQKNPDEPIVLLFDLAGAGIAHLDMEFIKFIITSFKVHYPSVLSYMLMYEMPWLFNAAWKVIKTMLHAESVKRIKFVTKSDIQAYIDKDQLWEHMGGTDTFVYKYNPEDIIDGIDLDMDSNSAARKRVTFADQDNPMYKSFSNDSIKETDTTASKPSGSILNPRRGPPSVKPNRRENQDDNSFIGRLLTISPAEELEFLMEEGAKEACDIIVLKNTLPYPIAYKVKTTSPEKYRVRPSSGQVKPGSEVEVTIHLQQGYQNTVHKDKFLIMAMEVANESNNSLAELWKNAQKESIMEHRLRCVVTNGRDNGGSDKGTSAVQKYPVLNEMSQKMDKLIECNRQLQKSVQMMLIFQSVFLLVLITALSVIFYSWLTNGSKTENETSWTQCTGS